MSYGVTLNFAAFYDIPNRNHLFLSTLAERGAVLLTVNFDCLVERAAAQSGRPLRQAIDLQDFDPTAISPRTLYKLHGSALRLDAHGSRESMDTVRSTIRDVFALRQRPSQEPASVAVVRKAVTERNLLVLGYSGYDDYDILPLLHTTKTGKRIVWVDHAFQTPAVHDYLAISQMPASKLRVILESFCINRVRTSENVWLIRANTADMLAQIGGVDVAAVPHTATTVDVTEHISAWGRDTVTWVDKLFCTIALYDSVQRLDDVLRVYAAYECEIRGLSSTIGSRILSYYSRAIAKCAALSRTPPSSQATDELVRLAETATDLRSKADIMNNLASLLISRGLTHEPELYMERAEAIYRQLQDPLMCAHVEMNRLLIRPRPRQEAMRSLTSNILPVAEQMGCLPLLARGYFNLAIIQGRSAPEEMTKSFDSAARYAFLAGDPIMFARAMAACHGNFELGVLRSSAFELLEPVLAQLEVVSSELIILYLALATSYHMTDMTRSLDYIAKAESVLDSVDAAAASGQKADLATLAAMICWAHGRHEEGIVWARRGVNELPSTTGPVARMDASLHLARFEVALGLSPELQRTMTEVSAIVTNAHNYTNTFQVKLMEFYYDADMYDKARDIYLSLLNTGLLAGNDLSPTEKSNCFCWAGNMYFNDRMYEDAFHCYVEALRIIRVVTDAYLSNIAVYYNLARIYDSRGQVAEAFVLAAVAGKLPLHDQSSANDSWFGNLRQRVDSAIVNRMQVTVDLVFARYENVASFFDALSERIIGRQPLLDLLDYHNPPPW